MSSRRLRKLSDIPPGRSFPCPRVASQRKSSVPGLTSASVPLVPLAVIGAVLAGLIGPEAPSGGGQPDISSVADSYDGFDGAAAEQLRRDQCLMADVLRLGGPAMGTLAQTGLDQAPEELRATANREYWTGTPLATAFGQDKDAVDQTLATLETRLQA